MYTHSIKKLDRELDRMKQEKIPELFYLAVTCVKKDMQTLVANTDENKAKRNAIRALNIILLLEAIRVADGCPENISESLMRVGMIVSDDVVFIMGRAGVLE